MKTIDIASRGSGAFVGILGFFGIAGAAIGAMLCFGAHRIVVARPDLHEDGLRIVGAVVLAVAALMLWWAIRQARAIRAIEVADDGGWTLITRRERRIAAPRGDATIALHGFTVWLTWSLIPRPLNVCRGRLTIGDAHWRLVQMAPSAYDAALSALGIDARAPKKGDASFVVARSTRS